jgi:exoribonuclease-2
LLDAKFLERKLVSGSEGVDVGHRLRVQLLRTDVERGYIDFKRVGKSRGEKRKSRGI